MQQVAIVKTGTVQHSAPMLRRFATKLVLDVLPATLTSIVGGVLVAHYQFGHVAQRPATEQVAPASAEMVKLVRDEHSAIMDYLKEQIATEKSRNAAADAADARAAAEAKASADASAAPPVVRAVPASVIAPKPVAVRSKPVVAAAVLPPHQPLVVAQAAPETIAAPVVATGAAAEVAIVAHARPQGSRGWRHAACCNRNRRHPVVDCLDGRSQRQRGYNAECTGCTECGRAFVRLVTR